MGNSESAPEKEPTPANRKPLFKGSPFKAPRNKYERQTVSETPRETARQTQSARQPPPGLSLTSPNSLSPSPSSSPTSENIQCHFQRIPSKQIAHHQSDTHIFRRPKYCRESLKSGQHGLLHPNHLRLSEQPGGFMRTASGSEIPNTHRNPELLSAWQKQLIKKSWAKNNKHGFENIGIRVYLKLLEKEPEIRRVFDFGSVPRAQLKFNDKFTHQAELFVGVLNYSVRDIDHTGGMLYDRLFSLGARHAHLTPGRFKVTYWDAFAEAMLDCVIEAQGVHSARGLVSAWRIFIVWLIETMKDGYYSQIQEMRHASRVAEAQAEEETESHRSSFSSDADVTPWKEIQAKFDLPQPF